MTTASTPETVGSRQGLPSLSLPARTGISLALAVLGNLVLAQVLRAAVDADPEFLALQAGPVAAASVVGVLLAVAAYAVLRRLGRERLFLPLVAVGALLSLGGPLGLLGATQATQPGVSDSAALALVPLHLLVGVVVARVLPRRAQ